jgi:hypothetical protein
MAGGLVEKAKSGLVGVIVQPAILSRFVARTAAFLHFR